MVVLGIFTAVNTETLYLTNFTINFWTCYTDYLIFKIDWMLLIMTAVFISNSSYSKHRMLCPGVWDRPLHCLGDSHPFNWDCLTQRGFQLPKSFSYGSCFPVIGWNFPLRSIYMFYTTKWRKKGQSSQLQQVKEQISHLSLLSALSLEFIPASPNTTLIKNIKERKWCLFIFLHMEILCKSEFWWTPSKSQQKLSFG